MNEWITKFTNSDMRFNQVIPFFDSEESGQVYTNEYIFDTVIFDN